VLIRARLALISGTRCKIREVKTIRQTGRFDRGVERSHRQCWCCQKGVDESIDTLCAGPWRNMIRCWLGAMIPVIAANGQTAPWSL
jgi:hypothetical protein